MKIVCISHGEDVDGLVCAAYLRNVKNALLILVNYDELKDALKSITPSVEELYICDLGVREALYEEIIRISGFANVTLVDHHPTSEKVLERLKHSGITVVYSALDCASVLLYNHFKHKLGREAARLAAYAAVSDRLEDGPLASSLLSWFDRHFIQYEALTLTYALDHKNTEEFRLLVVEELSEFTFPHRIKGVAKTASTHLDYMVKLIKTLPKKAEKLEGIAYVEGTNEISKGTVANLLVDSMGVDIGLCYKIKSDGTVNLSIRGKSGLNIHLGETSKKLAEKYNGFGGGHEKASGAKIPQKNLTKFLYDLNSELKRK